MALIKPVIAIPDDAKKTRARTQATATLNVAFQRMHRWHAEAVATIWNNADRLSAAEVLGALGTEAGEYCKFIESLTTTLNLMHPGAVPASMPQPLSYGAGGVVTIAS